MHESRHFHRALVPLDGSATAEAIIASFLNLALVLKLEVILLQVLARVTPSGSEGGVRNFVNPMESLEREAEAYLRRHADGLGTRGVLARTAVRVGDAATEIVQGAHEYQADLIAMTTHGRSGLGRLLFGSVAESVLRRASVPVFLMRITATEGARKAA